MTRRRRQVLAALGVLAAAGAASAPAFGAYGKRLEWGRQGSPTGSSFELTRGAFSDGREPMRYQGMGIGDRQYNSPGGLAFAQNGDVLVADTANNRVQRFTTAGRYRGVFGRFGFDPGASRVGAPSGFILVQGLATAGGSVFVADNRNDRVIKRTQGGRFQRRIGRRGSLRGQLVSPWGVAVHRGIVYVVDQGNGRIQRFTTAGRPRGSFGSPGRGRSQFEAPYGIAVRAGRVYVSDTRSDTVKVFTTGGRFVRQFGGRGSGAGEFDQPTGLAFDRSGRLFVSDCRNQRVQVVTTAGRHLETFGVGDLRDPTFIAVNRRGQVFVSDFRKVVRFDPGRGSARGASGRPGASAASLGLFDEWGDYVGPGGGYDEDGNYVGDGDGGDDGSWDGGDGSTDDGSSDGSGGYGRPPAYLACISQAEGTASETAGLGPEDG